MGTQTRGPRRRSVAAEPACLQQLARVAMPGAQASPPLVSAE